jgi:predicted PurR-regulated permease PerM
MPQDLPPQTGPDTGGGSSVQWARTTRYLAAAFLIVAIGVLLLFLIPVIHTVALGFIIAFLMYLPIRALTRRSSIRYSLAVILLYVLLVVIIVVIGVTAFSVFSKQSDTLSAALEAAIADIEEHEDALDQLVARVGSSAGAWLAEALASTVSGVLGLLGLVLAGLFFSFLLLLAMGNAKGALADWITPRSDRESILLLMKLDQVWVGYLVAQVIYGTALAVLSFIQYSLLGVPFPFVMAVLTGLISLIPTIGGLLASLIVSIPCLLLGSTVLTDMSNLTFALLVLALNVVITQITYNFFALPIVGKYVKLPTALVFVGVLVGVALGSIVLAFLAVPILSTLTIVGGYVLAKIAQREPFPGETVPDPLEEGFFSQLLIPSPNPTE